MVTTTTGLMINRLCAFLVAGCLLTLHISCSTDDMPGDPIVPMDEREPVDTAVQKTYTFLALGDSYTIGQGVEEHMRWPNQLSERLTAMDKEITETEIIARTGWTTGDLIKAINDQKPEQYDLVSLLIGVNNQFRGLPFSNFQSEFDVLLDMAVNLAGGKENLFVVSIPDYGVTPFGAANSATIAAELDTYNAFMEQRCLTDNILFINITDISRALGDSSNALAPDNLHPSGYQYSLWVRDILPGVVELID